MVNLTLVSDQPVVDYTDISTQLKFSAFKLHQLGRGFVAFEQSDEERAQGQYDPHTMFIHRDAENTDPAVMMQVEYNCAELARLLNFFRIDNDCITDAVKACGK